MNEYDYELELVEVEKEIKKDRLTELKELYNVMSFQVITKIVKRSLKA